MCSQNLTAVRAIYAGWASGETVRSMSGLIDPQVEVHPDPRSAWPGIERVYIGHAGIERYLASIYSAFAEYRAEPEQLLEAGERVVVLAIERGRGRHSGAPVEIRHTAHVWSMRDGRAVRLDVDWDRAHALRSLGLAAR